MLCNFMLDNSSYIFSKKLSIVQKLGIIYPSCCFVDSNHLVPRVFSQSAAATDQFIEDLTVAKRELDHQRVMLTLLAMSHEEFLERVLL